MRKHYDFSKAKPNPYARRLKQQVTIRLDRDTTTALRFPWRLLGSCGSADLTGGETMMNKRPLPRHEIGVG